MTAPTLIEAGAGPVALGTAGPAAAGLADGEADGEAPGEAAGAGTAGFAADASVGLAGLATGALGWQATSRKPGPLELAYVWSLFDHDRRRDDVADSSPDAGHSRSARARGLAGSSA